MTSDADMPIILDSEDDRGPFDFSSPSRAELEVFNLIPELCEALNLAFCRYMLMVGYHSSGNKEDERQCEADTAAFASYMHQCQTPDPCMDANLCALFINKICGLPFDQGYAWHRKVEAQEWRFGLKPIRDVTVSEQYQRLIDEYEACLSTANQPPK